MGFQPQGGVDAMADTTRFDAPPLRVSVCDANGGAVQPDAFATAPWSPERSAEFARSIVPLISPTTPRGVHVSNDARRTHALREAAQQRCSSCTGTLAAAGRGAVACLPRLWEFGAAPPFWRALVTLALTVLLALALDHFSSTLRLAWALSWPFALAAVVAEALYVVRALTSEDGPPVVLGLPGLVRLFDIWIAWAVCCGNIFMCFFIYDLHGRHFRGLEALSHDSSMLEASSYFLPFSLLYCSGGGLVFLEPATASTRLVVTAYAVLTFFFVVLVVYTGMGEVFSRRPRAERRLSARDAR